MKRQIVLYSLLVGLAAGWVAGTFASSASPDLSAPDSSKPVITRVTIEAKDIVVTVTVPSGVKKVTLESRTRLGAGTWVPRAVKRIEDASGTVVFRLARSEKLEVLRVRGDAQDVLPATYYAGKTNFNGQAGASAPAPGGAVLREGAPNADAAAPADKSRSVVESDIWSLRGNMLYFFNQYRGLQVIDLSVPDAPVVRGTLELPASGEQMYALDDQHVVLLARGGCSWGPTDGSQAIVVEVSGGTPKIAAAVTVPGYIQESRMVGTALYVASQAYREVVVPPKPGTTDPAQQMEWGSVISSFDLAQPAKPVTRDTLWYTGYGNVIAATDTVLFVCSDNVNDWWHSTVRLVDISAPDGTMRALSSINPAGRVPDKFKLNLSGDVFTVISEVWNWSSSTRRYSVLETYSLKDPGTPARLGRLELGGGEGLYATRFDGDRVYVVTFLRIDPLWVVDLKDPANPRIAGELQVPGWSTYIHPLGDRLVTIGIDNSNSWKVAVSLFDVHDPAKPALLGKVPMGENYSWSEANADEKAFTVLPDSGLILVPYQGWTSNSYASRVQLIDLGADTLKARGVIEHRMQPRRATVHESRIISVSGRELLTVNAADRDHPQVTSTTELSWAVDRVLAAGDYLITMAGQANWYDPHPNPTVRVARSSQPDKVLNLLELTNGLPVVGAAIRDGRLYLAQGRTYNYWWLWVPVADGDQAADPTNAPTLHLSVYDLAKLPELTLAGQTDALTTPLGWSANLDALWPKPGVLVWSQGASGGWWRGPMLDAAPAVRGGADLMMPWWGGWWGGKLAAFDVTDSTRPRFLAETVLTDTNGWWSFSKPVLVGSQVFLSHQGSEFLEGVLLPGQTKPEPIITTQADGAKVTNQPPIGIWVTKYFLDVVDYADPAAPTVRKPVNLPGALQGVGFDGALLYTLGPHWDAKWNTDWIDYVDASAYDGVQVSLVSSLKLSPLWPRPVLFHKNAVLVGVHDPTNSVDRLEAWGLSLDGQFAKVGSIKLDAPAQSLWTFGNLLAVQGDYSSFRLFDATDPAGLVPLAKGTPLGCIWADLGMADGNLAQGLWVPLHDYGVLSLPVVPQP